MDTQPGPTLKAYQRALRRHRATLDRLLDRRSAAALKKFYSRAQDDLERQLARMARESRGEALTPLQAQQLLAALVAGQRRITAKLAANFLTVSEEAQREGVAATDDTIGRLEEEADRKAVSLPLGEMAVVAMLTEKRRGFLTTSAQSAFQQFSQRLNIRAQEQLAVSLAMEESSADAIDRLRGSADAEWWQGERIVVTETAKAFNLAQADSIDMVAREVGNLYKRWTELVDDATGMPMDNRVGKDSIALHGQVTSSNGIFVMPPDPSVHRSFWNQTYYSSPNRPNDRSVTLPWRPSWGVPGWEWRDGQRVDIAPVKR